MVRDMAKQDVRNMGIPEDILNGEESISDSNIELKSERKRSNRKIEHSNHEKWDLFLIHSRGAVSVVSPFVFII